MGRSRSAQVRQGNNHIAVQEHETDSPLLPIAHLEKLQQLMPDKVDWVFQQTQIEGEFRRTETRRINTLIFTERIVSIISGLTIGVCSLGVSAYLALHGSEAVAAVIGGTTVVGLVTVFVIGSAKKNAGDK